jgi:hypothetical protein
MAILNTSGWVAYSVLEGNLFMFFGGGALSKGFQQIQV